MSGGVDSSVAALLLKQQGYDVVGVFMKNWEEDGEDGVCTAEQDWNDVREVCELIGIPYYAVNFAQEYWDRVFSYFLDEYRAGRTPNPDVLCNREIKFKAFLDFAMQLGASRMATGHFVQTNAQGDLLRGADPNKDQSYFLYMLRSAQLQKAMFPVGGMTKAQVRQIAEANGLPVSKKKDSTGVCFIGERRFKQFLAEFLPAQPGDMVAPDGTVVGRHDGLMYYTLGQRRGLGIGGCGDGRSWFVIGKDLAANRLLVAQGEDHPMLYSTLSVAGGLTWIAEAPIRTGETLRCTCKYRYRQADQPVDVTLQADGKVLIRSLEPQRAVTPGQSAVFYQGEKCIGGAVVEQVLDAGIPNGRI
ncbi:MAG: tRNA 2-thiouridine(34) synthase MnmA [Clostridia bacterium]|nr:tRNA 2-thiouridine(34) synthase MnmA [Clostridia bacterium]